MKSAVQERLNTIDRMVLLYKADVAISRNTEESLESAVDILKDAAKLTSNPTQEEEIAQKLDTARQKIEALKAPALAPEETQTEAPVPAQEEEQEAPAAGHSEAEAAPAHHE